MIRKTRYFEGNDRKIGNLSQGLQNAFAFLRGKRKFLGGGKKGLGGVGEKKDFWFYPLT